MGISASSLLDETKSNYIKGQTEAELKEFSPYYRKQFSVVRFSEAEDDLEQQKEKITQLLKQKEAPEEGEVLYEEGVLYFDDTRKWKERYVVVRANYCLECHDSLETFVKGVPPRYKLLPTGGTVLTTEESYMAMVDKCFPDDSNVKEDFGPPLSGMPGQFPVYLRLPYRRDSYFCFRQQIKQTAFLSIMSDCIRHQNQDFLKKKTCEVQAFLKAIQLYRQDKGKYEAWDMLIGSDVRVLANVVMEQMLPSLQKDMLPRLKAKKTEKKRVWFATVEAAYILIQEHLLDGLSALKEECRTSVRQQEVLIHSDMDQIVTSRRQLEEKIRAKMSDPAEKLCSESVQPYLGSVLEELMEPISSGFLEGRQLSENMMDQVCQDVLQGGGNEQLRKSQSSLSKPDLQSCYHKIGSLQDKLHNLQERFSFSNITGVIHSAQIDLQQLMENAAFTFETLLLKAIQDNPDNPEHAAAAAEKAKHRVLKQYDYDSSTVRKRLFQEALVSITLPFIKKNLAPTCKTELQGLDQSIDADHSNFIHMENVYESILLQTLDKEATKVVKEAASLKKYNLFTDSRDLLSQSSRSSLSSPSVSTPGSPAMTPASPSKPTSEPHPPSPLAFNGLSPGPIKEEQQEKVNDLVQSEASVETTPLVNAEVKEVFPSVEAEQQVSKVEEVVVQTVKEEPSSTGTLVIPALVEPVPQSQAQEAAAAPQTEIQEEVTSVHTEPAEPETQNPDSGQEVDITLSAVGSTKTGAPQAEVAAPQVEVAAPQVEVAPPQVEVAAPQVEVAPPQVEVAAPQAEVAPPQAEVAAPQVEVAAPQVEAAPPQAETPQVEVAAPQVEVAAPQVEVAAPQVEVAPPQAETPQAEVAAPQVEVAAPQVEVAAPQVAAPQVEAKAAPPQAEAAPPQVEVADPTNKPGNPTAEETGSQPEVQTQCESSEVQVAAPSGVETPTDVQLKVEEAGSVTVSDPNSLDVSVGSESPASDLESTDEVSTTSDVLEDEGHLSKSPVSSDEDKTQSDEPPPVAQVEAVSSDVSVGSDIAAGASMNVEASISPTAEPGREEVTPSSPEVRPQDCIKEIRDLVVEVIEVEELVQRYPSGIPKED